MMSAFEAGPGGFPDDPGEDTIELELSPQDLLTLSRLPEEEGAPAPLGEAMLTCAEPVVTEVSSIARGAPRMDRWPLARVAGVLGIAAAVMALGSAAHRAEVGRSAESEIPSMHRRSLNFRPERARPRLAGRWQRFSCNARAIGNSAQEAPSELARASRRGCSHEVSFDSLQRHFNRYGVPASASIVGHVCAVGEVVLIRYPVVLPNPGLRILGNDDNGVGIDTHGP
jgi:hypothetical protein